MIKHYILILIATEFAHSSASLRGRDSFEDPKMAIVDPCGEQTIKEIIDNYLTCTGQVFSPPAGVRSGFYYYATGEFVGKFVNTMRLHYFDEGVSEYYKALVRSEKREYDIRKDPFDIPKDVFISNGGICIPFGVPEAGPQLD